MKELIYKINHEEDFAKAQGMLEMLNLIYGMKYDFLARRVTRFDSPEASTAEKYAHAHDVWAEL